MRTNANFSQAPGVHFVETLLNDSWHRTRLDFLPTSFPLLQKLKFNAKDYSERMSEHLQK